MFIDLKNKVVRPKRLSDANPVIARHPDGPTGITGQKSSETL
jgi:hypothetical protein